MRYKEHEVPTEQLAANASDDMLFLTAIMGTVIGILLVFLGRKGKQMWMWVWGYGLIVCSVYLGLSMRFGVRWFGNF